MNKCPKISIVVPTYNRCLFLRKMLEKLFEDEYPNKEIIVVDGGSKDGTVQILESYGDKIKWVSEPDEGEYFALNKGLKMSTGDIIKPMSDDDLLNPGSFKLLVDFLNENPNVDIVFGQMLTWEKQNDDYILSANQNFMQIDAQKLNFKNFLTYGPNVSSIASSIRKSVFERVGYYSTKYSCGDAEFWVRCLANGLKMGLIPKVIGNYYYTGDNGVLTKKWEVGIDKVKIVAKYGNLIDVCITIWRHFGLPLVYHPMIWVFHYFNIHPMRVFRRVVGRL